MPLELKPKHSKRPLVLTDEGVAEIAAVVRYAEAHRHSLAQVLAMVGKRMPPPGNDPQHCVLLPFGYRCVFSIEQQPPGWMRHLSVSVLPAPVGAAPSVEAVAVLLPLFGFTGDGLRGLDHLDANEVTNDGRLVINCLQKVSE